MRIEMLARDYNRKNKAVPADPVVPGFPYSLRCINVFLKTLWLERPDIPHFTWSPINKERTCLFDIFKEYTSSDLLSAWSIFFQKSIR